jgi:VanZ family protein
MLLSVKQHLLTGLFFVWLIALLVLTYYPDLPETDVRIGDAWFRTDYMGHAGFYGILVLLFLLWQRAYRKFLNKRFIIWTLAGGILLGAFTEVTQHFIPGRSFNPFDLMYNCLGIVCGIVAHYFLTNKTRIRHGAEL